MRYLVTGGLGFIGSHLCQALTQSGHELTVLDDLSTGKREYATKGAKIIIGDAADAAMVERAMEEVDGCFHLAAVASVERSQLDWAGAHKVNLTATINVFAAAGKRHLPVVYASSAAIYGNQPDAPFTEEMKGDPISAYGADKYACEFHARVAEEIAGVPNIGLRFFNVYGPRQDPNSPYTGVISIFIKRALRGEKLIINGDGEQARDYVFAADVANALSLSMKALEEKRISRGVYNIGTGKKTSVNEVAAAILKSTGASVEAAHGPARAGDPRLSVADISKASKELGFAPKISLSEGITATVKHIKEHEL